MSTTILFTIPPKSRPEWRQLVRGELSHTFKNYTLQMKVHQCSQFIKEGKLLEQKAIDDLYGLCEKYALAVREDFKSIFKTW